MNTWLIKSEPGAWSWQDQLDAGEKGTFWDGVRNYQASNNMKAMKIGDQCFFYHSVKEKSIVGIVEVIKEYYPDHTDPKGRFGMVDVKAVQTFPTPVTLAEIKADPELENLALVRQSRLSVVPIDAASWKHICKMGKL
ncbi:EVE domain-containing protein [Sneathiella marina]|uniref:EVE domain-containing protein n=1 Tax=Sneathiella marina TaxID=2950108 RepID=A0ABY4W5A1_9PROT|nr:EVE domain-containing protein [Sneathiella marina]USG61283.1 EVE domain-containing protein [Sneathiella marina]